MDIKDLNKNQIVLLTLLVSFVTSIATGIVTVSLLQQAPQSVTKTINQIVERTVEKSVPVVTAIAGKDTVTKETTVVVKDEDLITKSIDVSKTFVVAVREKIINSQGLAVYNLVGWGVVLNKDGDVATDLSNITDDAPYNIMTSDGKSFDVKVLLRDPEHDIALLNVVRDKNDKNSQSYSFSQAKAANLSSLSLGQTLISFGGKSKNAVNQGILSSFQTADVKENVGTTTVTTNKIVSIEANVPPVSSMTGGPIINSFGEVIGISTASGLGDRVTSYVPITVVMSELAGAR